MRVGLRVLPRAPPAELVVEHAEPGVVAALFGGQAQILSLMDRAWNKHQQGYSLEALHLLCGEGSRRPISSPTSALPDQSMGTQAAPLGLCAFLALTMHHAAP